MEPELAALDEAGADLVACGVWQDLRPLRGLAGLLDWRLAGALSRLLRKDFLTGKAGETLLMPSHKRTAFPRLLLVGLGLRGEFGAEAFQAAFTRMRSAAAGVGARRSLLELPGRGDDTLDPAEAGQLVMTTHARGEGGTYDVMWLVEKGANARAFAERAAGAHRQAPRPSPLGG